MRRFGSVARSVVEQVGEDPGSCATRRRRSRGGPWPQRRRSGGAGSRAAARISAARARKSATTTPARAAADSRGRCARRLERSSTSRARLSTCARLRRRSRWNWRRRAIPEIERVTSAQGCAAWRAWARNRPWRVGELGCWRAARPPIEARVVDRGAARCAISASNASSSALKLRPDSACSTASAPSVRPRAMSGVIESARMPISRANSRSAGSSVAAKSSGDV